MSGMDIKSVAEDLSQVMKKNYDSSFLLLKLNKHWKNKTDKGK